MKIDNDVVVSGVKTDALDINGKAKSKFSIPLTIKYKGLKTGMNTLLNKSHLKYNLSVFLVIDTPIGSLDFDINKEDKVPIPKRPKFKIEKVEFKKNGFTSVTFKFYIKVTNNEEIKLNLQNFEYFASVNKNEIAKAKVTVNRSIQSSTFKAVIPVNVKFLGLKRALLDIFSSGKFKYKFDVNIKFKSKYNEFSLPYSKEGLSSIY